VGRRIAFTPEDLIACYRAGVFPMAESREADRLFIVDPERRGVFPLDRFHIPRRLARTIRQDRFDITINQDFLGVLDLCACAGPGRDGRLVGGLYGVALGGAFFGESMASRERDCSKVALAHLVARLRAGGFRLLDAQFHTEHLAQFGLEEISRSAFKAQLEDALQARGDFFRFPLSASGAQVLQSIAQMS
jgi:leucyl/phenylalanyl-tRNA--protein transferase